MKNHFYTIHSILLISLLCFLPFFMNAQEIIFNIKQGINVTSQDIDRIYVKPDATGNDDGTTWENAFTELQAGINHAEEGSEIWVAAGTYQPTEIPYTTGNSNVLKTFHLSKDVQLYGGFTGTETQLSERNPATNQTILNANGRYHTLIAANLSEAAIIDGFTIQGANGNAGFASTYDGLGYFHSNAGGVFLRNSDVQIRNCIFTNNRSEAGSGVMIQGTSKPTITNCLFFGNPRSHAIYTFQTAAPKIVNCTITNNAGGIYNRNETATPQYINTIIYGNDTNVTITQDCVPTFKNCLVEGSDGNGGWGIIGATDLGGNVDADPLFVSATDFSLIECSPAINAGDNTANTTTKDLAGNPRVFSSSMIDLGAYEWQVAVTPLPIQIVYVNAAANGANDGTSWTDAFDNLQDALAINKENCVAYQIWVAAGTYYPDEGVGQTDNDRNASFSMHNNVAIYGGLAGNEPANFDLNQRNIAANTTILSGDIDQNDHTAGGNTGNSHHILFNNDIGSNEMAVLDGFTITAGYSEDDNGAGIYNRNASPIFRNCTIAKNTARNGGGNYNNRSFSTWINCVFVGNLATQQGGGMYNFNSSHPRLINCTMEGNQSSTFGSALRNFTPSGSNTNSTSTLTNCILWNNILPDGVSSHLTIWGPVTAINSLIQDNNGFLDGRDYNNDPLFVQETDFADPTVIPDLRLQICSPLRNRGRNDANIDGATGSQTIADIAMDIAGNPRVFDGTIDLGAYEMQAIPNATTYTGDIIYVNAAVVGGAKNGTSWQNAYLNLQDALTQTCLSAATQIWVAKGTYYPDEGGGKVNNDRQARFVMQNGLKIIGGLVGNESPDYDLNNRDLVANKTILSGNIDQNVEDYTGVQFSGIDHNSFHLFDHNRTGLDHTAVLDGFTLTAANSPQGGGMRNRGSSPTIKNCVFVNNTSSQGGGLYFVLSDVTLANCDFLNNRGEDGVGIYSEDSNLNVNNCTFVGNIGASIFGANGAGIYHRGSGSLNCTNSLFTGNRVVLNELVVFDFQEDNDPERKSAKGEKILGGSSIGGAIYATASQPMKFINCTIEGNEAVQGGGGIFFNSNLSLINTIVWNNKGETDIGSATANVFTFSSNEVTADHSLVQGYNPTGTGNLDGTDSSIDPLFVSESEFVSGTTTISRGDLRLQRCSPLLNQGMNVANKQAMDLIGNSRVFAVENSGVIDLGAYEFQGLPFSTITANTTPATCQPNTSIANQDGKITVSGFATGEKFQYSTGTTFNANNAIPTTPTVIPMNGEIANNLANANQSYTLRITNDNGCSIDRTVNLSAMTCDCTAPVLADIANQTICVGETFIEVKTSVTNNVSVGYQWYNDNGTNNNNTNPISNQNTATFSALPTTAGTYKYRVEATRTDDATCTASKMVTLVVKARPEITFVSSAGNQRVCTGDEITFTATGGTQYEFFVNNSSKSVVSDGIYKTSTLANGDAIRVVVTGSNQCTTNSTTLTANIGDSEKPVPDVANLPDVTGQCSATATAPKANDNCAGEITATTTDPLTYNQQGTFTINWSYNDGNGNTKTQTQKVIINDTQAPTALCQNISVQLDANGQATITAAQVNNGSSDNCGNVALSIDKSTFTCADIGENNVTLTVDDGNGNTKTCTAVVTVTAATSVLSIDNASLTVIENNANSTATIHLSRTNPACAASVDYRTQNGTAMAGIHYSVTNGIINFAAGQSTATISIPIIGDPQSEEDKEFSLRLENESDGLQLSDNEAIITILDQVIDNTVLHFDGIDDQLTIDNFDLSTGFTLEFWIKYVGAQQAQEAIFSHNNDELVLGFENGKLGVLGTNLNMNSLFPTNVWKHVVLTVNSNGVVGSLVVDDVVVAGELPLRPHPTFGIATAHFGKSTNQTGFNGSLDEVRIWNDVRSFTEISNNMECEMTGAEDDLVLYFNFDDATANGDNTAINAIQGLSTNAYSGQLSQFDLIGSQSNFISDDLIFTNVCGAPALAVEWLDFSAQIIDNQSVALDWQVANELATTHYEVERSADGKTFENIGKVAANGDLNYQFVDKNPLRGDNFYRIKEVENSGRFSWSATKSVQLKSTATTLLVYPNPTTDIVYLQLPLAETENAIFTLIDIHGKTILQQKWLPELDLSTLASGVYLLRVKTTNTQFEQRIVKQ